MHRSEFGKEDEYKKIVFKEDFKIFGRQIENKEIVFDNCTFKKQFVLKTIEGNFGKTQIHFKYCKFEDDVRIEECQFGFLSFSHCTIDYRNLKLINNTIELALNINNTTGDRLYVNGNYNNLILDNLKFKKCILKDVNQKYSLTETKVSLLNNNIVNFDFEVESLYSKIVVNGGVYEWLSLKGEYKESLLFEEKSFVDNLIFESSVFKERIDFRGGSYKHLCFYRSSFEGLIWFSGFDIIDKTHNDLEIDDLTIHSNNFEKNFSLDLSKIEGINLSNNNFKKLFSFDSYYDESNQNDNDLEFKNCIRFSLDSTNQGNILVRNSFVDITLSGINLGNIYFKNLKVFTIHVSDFQNNGNVSFSEIIKGNQFVIQNSAAGNLEFLNVNFKKFNEIVISDSNIDKTSFSSYPFKIRSYSSNPKVGYGIENKSLSKSNLKNVYNQLKKVAKNKGNIDVANKYQSLEYKYLFFEKSWGFDKLLLFFNFISNNHGRYWFQGVVFTLSVGLLCFYQYYTFFESGFTFNELLKEYVIFISSFPKLELEKYSEIPKTWDVSLIIWISRIFISYGIYQTIAAFRKYGKS